MLMTIKSANKMLLVIVIYMIIDRQTKRDANVGIILLLFYNIPVFKAVIPANLCSYEWTLQGKILHY